jgi:xylulose-5-phosphate/fructose-6-phosphate phosphoketolase
MATTGLASSAASKFDGNTPTKASLLSPDVGKLLVNLDDRVQALRSQKEGGLDLEGLLAFQHVANYLYVQSV